MIIRKHNELRCPKLTDKFDRIFDIILLGKQHNKGVIPLARDFVIREMSYYSQSRNVSVFIW